jgi:hypothetical protein
MLISEAAPPGVERPISPGLFMLVSLGPSTHGSRRSYRDVVLATHAEAVDAQRLASKEGATASGGSVHGSNLDKQPEGAN